MWYFAWMLGVGFAVLLGVLNALWAEHESTRRDAFGTTGAPRDRND